MKQIIDNSALFGAIAGTFTFGILHLPLILMMSLVWVSWVGTYAILAFVGQVAWIGINWTWRKAAAKFLDREVA